MRKILKYTIECSPKTHEIPKGGTIVHVCMQNGSPRIWVLCEAEAPLETRVFEREITGSEFDGDLLYVGTAISDGGSHVVHIFERPKPRPSDEIAVEQDTMNFVPEERQHFWQNPVVPEPAKKSNVARNLLMFRFHTYMKASDRNAALIDCGIVPDVKVDRLPQTVETELIRRASNESLAMLWDRVAQFSPSPVSPAVAPPNPFRAAA